MAITIKIIIAFLFLVILFALGSALVFLVRGQQNDSERIVKALTWRIGLSILLFMILLIAFAFGWITPHTIF